MPTAETCSSCGVSHAAGELFVDDGLDQLHPLVDTCELEPAWRTAHASPMRPGSRAYHATTLDLLEAVLTSGLDPSAADSGCKHICFAPTPAIAAGTMEIVRRPLLPPGVVYRVLEIDVSGLDIFFELGEARHHGDRLDQSRIVRVLESVPTPTIEGWSNPGLRRQHSDCLALNGYPIDRRALRQATPEADRRHGYEHTKAQYREIALELAAARAIRRQRP